MPGDATLDWYDYLFKGAQNDFAKGKPVKLFVMGANEWREEDSWPVPNAQNPSISFIRAGKATP